MSHFGKGGPPDVSNTYSLLVLNITFRTTADELYPLFDRCGKVMDIYIPRDRKTNQSRGFAFVRYGRRDDAEEAIKRLDGKVIDGRDIVVQFAKYGRADEPIEKGKITDGAPDKGKLTGRDRDRDRGGRDDRDRSPDRRRQRSPDRRDDRRDDRRRDDDRDRDRRRDDDRGGRDHDRGGRDDRDRDRRNKSRSRSPGRRARSRSPETRGRRREEDREEAAEPRGGPISGVDKAGKDVTKDEEPATKDDHEAKHEQAEEDDAILRDD